MKAHPHNPMGACSSCWNSKPDMVHVDFEASWDGPRFENALPNGEPITIPVQIDDLILCAECIMEAAQLVPDARDPVMARLRLDGKVKDEQIERLEQQVVTLKRALQAAEPKVSTKRPPRKAAA